VEGRSGCDVQDEPFPLPFFDRKLIDTSPRVGDEIPQHTNTLNLHVAYGAPSPDQRVDRISSRSAISESALSLDRSNLHPACEAEGNSTDLVPQSDLVSA
jgi:hypothetical protein